MIPTRSNLLRRGYSSTAIDLWFRLPKSQQLMHPSIEEAQAAGLIDPDLCIYQPFDVVVRLPSGGKHEFRILPCFRSAIDVYKQVASKMNVPYVSLRTKEGRELSSYRYLDLWRDRHHLKFYAQPSEGISWDERPELPPREALAQIQQRVAEGVVANGEFAVQSAAGVVRGVMEGVDQSLAAAFNMSPSKMVHCLTDATEGAISMVKSIFAPHDSKAPVTAVVQEMQRSIASRFGEPPQVLDHTPASTSDAPLHLALEDHTMFLGARPNLFNYPKSCRVRINKSGTSDDKLTKPTKYVEPGDRIVIKWKPFEIEKEKKIRGAGLRNSITRRIVGSSVSGPDLNGTTLVCLDWRVVGGKLWVNLVAEKRLRITDHTHTHGPCFVVPMQPGEYAVRVYRMYGGAWELDGEYVFKMVDHVMINVGVGSPVLELDKAFRSITSSLKNSYLVSALALQANQHLEQLGTYSWTTTPWENSAKFANAPRRGGPPQLERIYAVADIDAVPDIRIGLEAETPDFVWYATRLRDSVQAVRALLGYVQLSNNNMESDTRFWDALPEALQNRLVDTFEKLSPAVPLGGRSTSKRHVSPEKKMLDYVRSTASLVGRHIRFRRIPTSSMRTFASGIMYDDDLNVFAENVIRDAVPLIVLQIALVRGRVSPTLFHTDIEHFALLGKLAHNYPHIKKSTNFDRLIVSVEEQAQNVDFNFEIGESFIRRKKVGEIPLRWDTVRGIYASSELPPVFPVWIHYRAQYIHSRRLSAAPVYPLESHLAPTSNVLPIMENPTHFLLDMQLRKANPWESLIFVQKPDPGLVGPSSVKGIQLSSGKRFNVELKTDPELQIHYKSKWYVLSQTIP